MIPDTAHGTNPASVTMAGYELVARADRRARQHRPRRPARQGRRAHGRPDADEPLDARAVRREHRARSREIFHGGRGAHVLRRREPERRLRHLAARATWASTSCTINLHKTFSQPHGGGGPGGGPVAVRERPRAVPARAGRRRATATASGSTTTGPRSIGKVRGFARPVRRLRPLLRVHAHVGPGSARDARGRRAERELPARAAARRLRAAVSTVSACTSSSSRRAGAQARARRHRARRRQAADGLRLPPADGLLPARSSRRR